jgi:hypothetical protein
MKVFLMIWLFVVVTVVAIMGVRGGTSTKPPLYLFPDMDDQAKTKPQGTSAIFADNRTDRLPVAGTVPRGYTWQTEVFTQEYAYPVAQNPAVYSGKDASGEFYEGFPLPVDEAFVVLGQQKYNIYCQVCHGTLGDGKGIVAADGTDYTMNRGYFGNVANLTSDTYVQYSEGMLFDRITNGWNTMYPYKDKLSPQERWAVVAYLRALQLAANASIDDVPEAHRKELGL